MPRFLNPFNFVRPLPAPERMPQLSEGTHEQYLMWQCAPPPHDRLTGMSGVIKCKMTAQTPIFVSDTSFTSEMVNNKEHRTYPFFNINETEMIPATSLRGSIRNIFEAVTNSRWSILSDSTLTFRARPRVANELKPGYLIYREREGKARWYFQPLPGLDNTGSNNTSRFAKVPFKMVDDAKVKHGRIVYFTYDKRKSGLKVNRLSHNDFQGATVGILCATGRSIPNKKHDRIFFDSLPEPSKPIRLRRKMITRYNLLMESLHKYHEDTVKRVKSRSMSARDAALSRFHYSMKNEKASPENELITSDDHAFPVYLKWDDRNDQPDYLAPVSIPRILEARSFHDILEQEGFGHLLPATDYDYLSPADRIFGWVRQDDSENDESRKLAERVSYKGRVRFTHATVRRKAAFPQDKVSLTILSGPKPTTTRFYIEPRNGVDRNVNAPNNNRKGFSDNNLRFGRSGNMLRGRKIYRHHMNFRLAEAQQQDDNSDQNRSITGIHDAGTEYSFEIKFENLQPVELGALLWTLQLQDDNWQGYHRLGYAKPLGFGSVAIEITEASYFTAERYTRLADMQNVNIADCINRFKQAISRLYTGQDNGFNRLNNIRDLQTLLGNPAIDTIHYPRTTPQRSKSGDKNYEWFQQNTRPSGPNLLLPYAEFDVEGLPYMRRKGRDVEVDW